MIKVNLLRTQTAPKRGPAISKKPFQRSALLLVAALLLPIGGLSVWWFSLNSQIGSLTVRRDQLRVENQRLEGLKKQLVEFEKKKQERMSRINLIESLRANQTGPVLLLNHVIHSLPLNSVIWLTGMEQKGDRVRITGFTARGESVPDFMSKLAATGFFRTVDLELFEDQQKDEAARFVLVCITNIKAPTE
jgi:Tfp pilus assembly protein PilN